MPAAVTVPTNISAPVVIQLPVSSRQSDGFVSLKEEEMTFEVEPALLIPNEVDSTARDRLLEVDEGIRFLSYSM